MKNEMNKFKGKGYSEKVFAPKERAEIRDLICTMDKDYVKITPEAATTLKSINTLIEGSSILRKIGVVVTSLFGIFVVVGYALRNIGVL